MLRLIRLNLISVLVVIIIISVVGFKLTNGSTESKNYKAHSNTTKHKCESLKIPICKQLEAYSEVRLPNFFGHSSQDSARQALRRFLELFVKNDKCSRTLKPFLCYLYAPPCSKSRGSAPKLLPCRGLCEAARGACESAMNKQGLAWPIQFECRAFTSQGCLGLNGTKLFLPAPPVPVSHPKLEQSKKSVKSLRRVKLKRVVRKPVIKPRRYDIADPGDSTLFQGWADVQGQGAANDYCRVIGRHPHNRFLSCALAGSTGNQHMFVSKRGFDVGHRGSWFMRDMDADGRDDYCRCVGRGIKTQIVCMKAGPNGFYGNPMQPGNQMTITVKRRSPCIDKLFNPFLGVWQKAY